MTRDEAAPPSLEGGRFVIADTYTAGMSELAHGNGIGSGFDAPVSHSHERQNATNAKWPFRDSQGPHARGVRDQPGDKQIDVRVRVVFDRDGEEWLDGRAITWANRCVMVAVNDTRLRPGLVWVDASDVQRR